MKFLKEMKVNDIFDLNLTSELPQSQVKIRHYNPLVFLNGVKLSIQASAFHYCDPRETVDLEEYTTMELAIIEEGHFIQYYDELEGFSYRDELMECYEEPVYSHVPINIINELFLFMESKLKLYGK